jgi:hypothetical protein
MTLKTISIEGCEIVIDQDSRSIKYTAKAAIDDDGSGLSHGDPDFQADTSLHLGGKALNADVDQYIVVPPAIIEAVPEIVLGSQAYVSYGGKTVPAVVGDIGPHEKLGEISIATARALGIPSSPLDGGIDGYVVAYQIFPGDPAYVNGVTYRLQPSKA